MDLKNGSWILLVEQCVNVISNDDEIYSDNIYHMHDPVR